MGTTHGRADGDRLDIGHVVRLAERVLDGVLDAQGHVWRGGTLCGREHPASLGSLGDVEKNCIAADTVSGSVGTAGLSHIRVGAADVDAQAQDGCVCEAWDHRSADGHYQERDGLRISPPTDGLSTSARNTGTANGTPGSELAFEEAMPGAERITR